MKSSRSCRFPGISPLRQDSEPYAHLASTSLDGCSKGSRNALPEDLSASGPKIARFSRGEMGETGPPLSFVQSVNMMISACCVGSFKCAPQGSSPWCLLFSWAVQTTSASKLDISTRSCLHVLGMLSVYRRLRGATPTILGDGYTSGKIGIFRASALHSIELVNARAKCSIRKYDKHLSSLFPIERRSVAELILPNSFVLRGTGLSKFQALDRKDTVEFAKRYRL